MFSRRTLKFTALTTALAIGAAAAQFVSTIFLEANLSKPLFSQITVILGYFATYFLLVELGIQEELVKQLKSDLNPEAENSSVILRILGALVAFIALIVNSWLTGVSSEVFWGTISFGLCFFPAGLLLTSEAKGYINIQPFRAAAFRLSRGLGIIAFTIILLVWQPEQMGRSDFVVLFLIFPVFYLLNSVIFGCIPRPAKKNGWRQDLKLFSKTTWPLMASRFLTGALAGLFYHFCVSFGGEKNLAELMLAIALTAPASICLQVSAQIYFTINQEKLSHQWGLALANIAAILAYGLSLSFLLTHQLLFTNLNSGRLLYFFWPMLIAVLINAISIILTIKATGQKRVKAALLSPLTGIVTLGIIFSFVPTPISFNYIGFAWLGALLLSLFTTFSCVYKKHPATV